MRLVDILGVVGFILFQSVWAAENESGPPIAMGGQDLTPREASYFLHRPGDALKKIEVSIKRGRDLPVCKAYANYISAQSFRPDGSDGPRCYRHYLQSFAGVSRPPVRFPSSDEKRTMLTLIQRSRDDFLWYFANHPPASDAEMERYTMWNVPEGLDVDHNGVDDPVYFLAEGKCDEASTSRGNRLSVTPYIWDPKKGMRNEDLTVIVAGTKWASSHYIGSEDDVFDFFNFAGRTYFDVSATLEEPVLQNKAPSQQMREKFGKITVYSLINNGRITVCELSIPL